MTEHAKRVFDECDTVYAMVRRSGRCPADDFISGLEPKFAARFERYLEYLWHGHRIQSPEHLRRLDSGDHGEVVFELKVNKYRLYAVKYLMCWYLTHGRTKPKDNRVNEEISKALEIFWEWNGG